MRARWWILGGLGLVVLVVWSRRASASVDAAPLLTDNVMDWINNLTQDSAANEALYRDAIAAAEFQYSLPEGLLHRVLYQESRFRSDIITGATASPAGALGIAQFMPATAAELGFNPLDPYASISGSARYLRDLRKQTNSWAEALAAYNWGIGNVKRKGLAAAPAETKSYVAGITADVGVA